MSSEEKMKWKQEEEKNEEQKNDRMEILNEIEETLLAIGPFKDQIVIYDEEIKDTERNEYSDSQDTKEELKHQQEILDEEVREKREKEDGLMIEPIEEKKVEYKEKTNEERVIEEVKEDEKIEQVVKQDGTAFEERVKMLEEIEKVLLRQEDFADQKIIWEDEKQKKRFEAANPKEKSVSSPEERDIIELNALEDYEAICFNKNNERELQFLDKELFSQLIKNQRLEWQRDWFTGFEKNISEKDQRKLFLLDLSKNQSLGLPSDMKRIWVIKNEPKWNYIAPTKRELHGNSIKGLMSTLFGNRNKCSDFNEVTRYSYEKAMKKIWIEFQTTFTSEIRLRAKNRPAIKALKANYSRESVDKSMIGSLWYYYNGLNRQGKNDLEKGGYKSLVEFIKNDNPKGIPFATDISFQMKKKIGSKNQVSLKINRKFEVYGSTKMDLGNVLEKLHLDKYSFNYESAESQRNLVKGWNHYVDSKNKPSIDMWRLYNKIQIQCDSPLLYIHRKDDQPRLRLKRDIQEAEILYNKTLKKYPTLRNATLITEWLKFRQKIKGKNPLIEIKITNPLNNKEEIWFIRNNRNRWNPEGLPFKNDTAEKRFVSSEFFEEWKFRDGSYNIKIGEIKGYMPHSIKKSIIDNLFSETSVPNGAVFTQAYNLKMNAETIDEYFEWLWSKHRKTIKQIDETRPKLQGLENYYKGLKVEDKVLNVEITEKFDIFLFDKSRGLFKSLFSELQTTADYEQAGCNNLEEWWELVKKNITVKELATSLLRATHTAPINKTQVCYHFYDANTSRFGPLSKDPIRFWSETFENSFSSLAAALMENEEIRQVLTNFVNENDELGPLKLKEGVDTYMKGHDTGSEDLISVPDGLTKKGHLCSDVFQNKLSRPIGRNQDEINAEDYLLDWLKTVGNYDPKNFSINNLQLEFIPKGDSLNGLTNIAEDHNAIIISYWGKTALEIGRFMEVISAIRVNNFKRQKKQNLSEEELRKLVIDNLEQKTHLYIQTGEIDDATMHIIDQFLPEGVKATGEGTFLKNSLIDLLKLHGDNLLHDYYPSFSKE
ncbi:MAG: hypothetical protein ACXAAT_18060 [Candidatus Hodarchaeales archaeon]